LTKRLNQMIRPGNQTNKMTELDKSTEEKILDAANKVFVEKGLDGTRMQQIADEAKINKSLLHYYYRSKDKLFAEVFKRVITKVIPQTLNVFKTEKSLFEKIEIFTEEYINLIQKHPVIPLFVLHEINKNPSRVSSFASMLSRMVNEGFLKNIETQIQEESRKGIIREIDAKQLIINTLSLCLFPFIARPIIQHVFLDNNPEAFQSLIQARKKEVADFVIQSIRIEKK